MRKSRGKTRKVTRKSERVKVSGEKLTLTWTIDQLLGEVAGEIEAFSAQIGLRVMHAVMDHEVGGIVGPWGRQSAYRHGQRPWLGGLIGIGVTFVAMLLPIPGLLAVLLGLGASSIIVYTIGPGEAGI